MTGNDRLEAYPTGWQPFPLLFLRSSSLLCFVSFTVVTFNLRLSRAIRNRAITSIWLIPW